MLTTEVVLFKHRYVLTHGLLYLYTLNNMPQTKIQTNTPATNGRSTNQIEDEFSSATKDSFKEKLGQGLISIIGSWPVVFIHIAFFGVWLWQGWHYEWLTFWVSLEAIILALLILIEANDKSESDRQRAIKDYKVNMSVAQKVKEMDKKLDEISHKLNV
jgi:uncharacterized membrane protein